MLRQTLSTGDAKGFGYAVSSIQLTLAMFACAYVAFAAARVPGAEEGDLIYVVGGTWKWFVLLGAVSFYLECVKFVESVVGVADAQSLERALHEPSAVEQLALADLLLLNKTDLCSAQQTEEVANQLQQLNPAAPIVRCQQGQAPIEEILRARTPRGLEDLQTPTGGSGAHPHAGQAGIEALSLRGEQPLDAMKVQLWLDACAKMLEGRLIRYKGFLDLAGETRRGILQGVYELYTVSYGPEWREDEPRVSELVFIGRDLDATLLERGMRACVADV